MEVLGNLLGVIAQPVKCLLLNYRRLYEAIRFILNNLLRVGKGKFLGDSSTLVLLWFNDPELSLMNPDLINAMEVNLISESLTGMYSMLITHPIICNLGLQPRGECASGLDKQELAITIHNPDPNILMPVC